MNKKEKIELAKDLVIFGIVFAFLSFAGIMTGNQIISVTALEPGKPMTLAFAAILTFLIFFFSAFIGGVIARRTHREAIPVNPKNFVLGVLFLCLVLMGWGFPSGFQAILGIILRSLVVAAFAWMGYSKPRRRLLPGK